MHKLALLATVIALAAAPAAHAQQSWSHLGTAEGEWTVSYDPSRLDRSGATVKVWLKRDLVAIAEGVSYFISQAEIDCAERTARILFTASYDAAGSVVARDPQPVPAEPIPPGSFFETVQERVCG